MSSEPMTLLSIQLLREDKVPFELQLIGISLISLYKSFHV